MLNSLFKSRRSLATRIMVYVLSAISGFILLVGGGSFLIVETLLNQQIYDRLNLDLRQVSLDMQHVLKTASDSLQHLSNHPLLANALTDSIGRDTYLKPFFLQQSLAKQTNGDLLLSDFKGESLLATNDSVVNSLKGEQRIKRIIAEGQPYAEVTFDNHLMMIYPVVFPPTGTSEGAVIYRLDLSQLLVGMAKQFDTLLILQSVEGFLSSRPDMPADLLDISSKLKLSQPLDQLDFNLTVAQPRQEMVQSLYQMIQAFSLAALVLLMLAAWLASGLSRNLIKQLNILISQVDSIKNTSDVQVQTNLVDRDLEPFKLAEAFNHLLKRLDLAYSNLEVKAIDLSAAQESARHAALYSRSLIETSLDPLVTISSEGKITDVNKASEKVTGINRQSLIGSDFVQYFTEPELAKLGCERALTDSQVYDFPLVIRHQSGKLTEMFFNITQYRNDQGQVQGIFATARDMTQQKQIENELRSAKIDAEAANQAKSDFLANMSHEIRTPINAIVGFMELTMDTSLNFKQRDYLNKVQQATRTLLYVINEILDISKIEAGKISLEMNPFELNELIQDITDTFALPVESKGIELFVQVTPAVPDVVNGDVIRIRQVLTNLINNAVKFTEQGEIHIKVDVVQQQDERFVLSFSVRDSGIGLTSEEINRLFYAFSQADSSISRRYGGTGLGLAICRQLVEIMGGQISVSSHKAEGSNFIFTLPVIADLSRQTPVLLHNKALRRILVVDDKETSCQIIKNYFEQTSIEVVTTTSASFALAKIQQTDPPFDLILLDWLMPEMNGLDLASRIIEQGRQEQSAQTPILMMATEHNQDNLLQQSDTESINCDFVLTKPVSKQGLVDTINQMDDSEKVWPALDMPQNITLYELAKPIQGSYILLVEDNPMNQLITREFLQKVGIRLVVAEQGSEAVEWVKRERFDAILMDLQMPVMDGFEATRIIRALAEGKQIPIIAMTAAAMQHDRDACLAAGMNDHLAKPMNSRQLIDALLRWIKPKTASSTIPKVDKNGAEFNSSDFYFSNLLPTMSGNSEHFSQILTMFKNNYADIARLLVEYITDGELDLAEKQVHMLKGVAGNIGAIKLAGVSQQLDEQLKQHYCDPELLTQWQSILESTLQSIEVMLKQQLTQSPGKSRGSGKHDQLSEIVLKLDKLLSQHDFIESDLLLQLELTIEPEQRVDCQKIINYIKKLDYTNARLLLSKLEVNQQNESDMVSIK